jgi:hypothetical protein
VQAQKKEEEQKKQKFILPLWDSFSELRAHQSEKKERERERTANDLVEYSISLFIIE